MKLGKQTINNKDIDLDLLVNDNKSPLSSWKREFIKKQNVRSISKKDNILYVCGQKLYPFDIEHFPELHLTTTIKSLYGDLSISKQRASLVNSKSDDVLLTPIPLQKGIISTSVEDIDPNNDVLWCTHEENKFVLTLGIVNIPIVFACVECKESFKLNENELKAKYTTVQWYERDTDNLAFERKMWLPLCSQKCLELFEKYTGTFQVN